MMKQIAEYHRPPALDSRQYALSLNAPSWTNMAAKTRKRCGVTGVVASNATCHVHHAGAPRYESYPGLSARVCTPLQSLRPVLLWLAERHVVRTKLAQIALRNRRMPMNEQKGDRRLWPPTARH